MVLPALARIAALELIVTARCPLRCSYCYQSARGGAAMPWPTLRAALDLLLVSRAPARDVAFHGGEPLLEFPLVRRAVRYVRRARRGGGPVRLTLLTNGLRLDDRTAAFLARHHVITQLSFDGVPAVQERRAPGTFQRLDALLARLRARQPAFYAKRFSVNMTLRAATLAGFADSVAYFLGRGVAELTVTPLLTPDPEWRPELIDRLRAQYARVEQLCRRHHEATGRTPLVGLRAAPAAAAGEATAVEAAAPCAARAGRKLTVGPDGGVAGCIVLSEAIQRPAEPRLRARLAALRLGALDDPELSPRLARLPARLADTGLFDGPAERYSSYGRCAACRHRGECGFCPVSLAHGPGPEDPRRVPDHLCAFNRVQLEMRARYQRAVRRASSSGVG